MNYICCNYKAVVNIMALIGQSKSSDHWTFELPPPLPHLKGASELPVSVIGRCQ